MVTIALFIVDFNGIENQVRLFGRNGLDEMLVTVIVLLGDGEFYGGANLLRHNSDVLRVARGHVETNDLSVGGQADGGAFVGFHLVLLAASGQYG